MQDLKIFLIILQLVIMNKTMLIKKLENYFQIQKEKFTMNTKTQLIEVVNLQRET